MKKKIFGATTAAVMAFTTACSPSQGDKNNQPHTTNMPIYDPITLLVAAALVKTFPDNFRLEVKEPPKFDPEKAAQAREKIENHPIYILGKLFAPLFGSYKDIDDDLKAVQKSPKPS